MTLDYEPRRPDVRVARRRFGWFLLCSGVAAPPAAWIVAQIGVAVAASLSSRPGDVNIGVGCAGLLCIYASLFYALVGIIYGLKLVITNRSEP